MSWFHAVIALFSCFFISLFAQGEEPGSKGPAPIHTDLYGDPLPPGAVARMGTIRLRHEYQGNMATAFSPDGKILASGVHDTIRLWSTSTGKLILQIKANYDDGPLVFSPDSKWLATTFEQSIVFLDASNGQLIKRIPAQSMTFAFSPNGETLAVSSKDGSVFLWNTKRDKQTSHLVGESKRPALHLGFSKDGKTVISLTRDNKLSRWGVATGKLEKTISMKLPDWREVDLSPDMKTLAVMPTAAMQPIQLWDVDKGERRLDLQGDKAVTSRGLTINSGLTFSWDSQSLATNWYDNRDFKVSLCLWDTASGKLRREFPVRASNCRFSPNGQSLLTRSSVLRLWDASTGRQLVEFPGHEGSITSLSFTPDGHELVSAGGGTIQVWEASTGKHLRQLLGSSANVLAVLPDGHSVLSGGYDAMLHLLEIDSGQETRRFLIDKDIAPLLQDRHVVWSLGLSPDGKTAASYSMESVKNQGFLHVWDLTSGKALAINRVPSARLVFRLFSPDAKLLVRHEPINSPIPRNGRFDQVEENPPNAVVLQDSLTGKPVLSLPQMDQINIVQSFSSDGQVLATATYKAVRRGPDDREGPATIHIWELISGKERQTMAIPGEGDAHLQDLVFSPDQRVIATACSGWKSGAREHWIQLWDTVSGKELLRLSGYDSNTRKLAFSPDGRFLVSGHEEGYLLVWDVSPISPFKASKPKRVSSAELESCWADLAGEDAHKAGEAIWKLVDTGSQAVELFRSRLHPAPGPPADKMKQWIADLDSNDFERREEATRQLAALQDLAQPALKEVLKGKMSAEQRRRIEPLLQPYFLVNGPDKRQQLRSIQVLERIGTPEAQAVLAELAKGAPEARLTIAAKAAQERLSRSVLFKNNRENLTK